MDLEYGGLLDSWSKISENLFEKKMISQEALQKIKILEIFGHLIGNTDMHPGNLSFFTKNGFKLDNITPVYDMLPMLYYPRQNQMLTPRYQPKLPLPENKKSWQKAVQFALEFWRKAARDNRISKEFQKISSKNFESLEKTAHRFNF